MFSFLFKPKKSSKSQISSSKMWHGLPMVITIAGAKYELINRFDDDELYDAKIEAREARAEGHTVVLKHMQNYEGNYKYALYAKIGGKRQPERAIRATLTKTKVISGERYTLDGTFGHSKDAAERFAKDLRTPKFPGAYKFKVRVVRGSIAGEEGIYAVYSRKAGRVPVKQAPRKRSGWVF